MVQFRESTAMKTLKPLSGAGIACALSLAAAPAQSVSFRFERFVGAPFMLVWDSLASKTYDLWRSDDLTQWTRAEGYPKHGTGMRMEHPFTADGCGFFRITADDEFALIPAGSFLMGDQSDPLVGYSDEGPVHSVQVSAFYLAKHEMTKEMWDRVAAWAAGNGYDLNAAGGLGSKTANHPVHSVLWNEVVKWCNARSQKEGLAPCYRVAGAVYKTGPDNSTVACDFGANGYRLPTEAEWEKAARGGLTGLNFPWGNTISHAKANYYSNSNFSYDVSRSQGYHPTYAVGGIPYSSPVGSFAPNGYGLYDMAGNVWEWCWDWYESYKSSPQTDPRGPASGWLRVFRGGGWSNIAWYCRAAGRCNYGPAGSDGYVGFRLARSSVP
jgi:formylglycine-generating enzyme required for sulfatase activity